MKWENELTQALRIKYPIVQAPMLGVTTPEMVAAVANLGGLGSLPVGGLSPEATLELIRKTKNLTDRPFAVNLFVHQLPAYQDEAVFESMQDLLEKISKENNLGYKRQLLESLKFLSYADQIDCLLSENIPIVSFTFGQLDNSFIKAFKDKGVILIGTATCLEEAELLDRSGIDMITAQGIEAGGHRGTFLENIPLPMISSDLLTRQVTNKISRPVLAAGGIHDGKTILKALALGAKGVQIGTAFVASDESIAIPAYKESLQHAVDSDIVLTKAISGRWARGLKNKFITAVESSGIEIPPFPIQGGLTASIRMEAQKQNNKELTSLWAGMSASASLMKPVAEIFKTLVEQAEEDN